MATSIQLGTLRNKLREAGCTVQSMTQHQIDEKTTYQLWLVYRGDKPPLRVVIIDQLADGYSLFLEEQAMKVDDDVRAITASPPFAID